MVERSRGQRKQEEFVLRVKPTGYTVFLESEFEAQYQVMKTLDTSSDVTVPKFWWYETDPAPARGGLLCDEPGARPYPA